MGTWSEADGRPEFRPSRARVEHILEHATLLGIREAAQHYAAIDASRRELGTRWRRGLFRLWCALSLLWLAFVVAMAAIHMRDSEFLGVVAIAGFGIPVTALAVSTAVIRLSIWVVNGFRGGP
jgi:hypothetical protein